MLDALGPAQIRDVYQSVDAVFDLDEGAKVCQVAHTALDHCACRIALGQVFPGVVEKLLHAQRNAAVGRIHAQHNGLNFIARLHQLRRMLQPLRPSHLREVNQALDALLQLDKRAVVGNREHAAMHMRTHRVALAGVQPRVRRQLLEAQGYALLVLVELQHLYLDLVTDVDQNRAGASNGPNSYR